MLSSLLLVFLVGCTTPKKPAYKVKLSPLEKPIETSVVPAVVGGEASQQFDSIIRKGSGQVINAPVKRRYRKAQGEYNLDFANLEVYEFISIVFKSMLKEDFIFDNSIKGTVTVQTEGDVNRTQLLSIVETVLASKNAVMVAERGRFNIMPRSKVKNYSLTPSFYTSREAAAGYKMVVVPIKHINPDDLKPILESVAPNIGKLKIDKVHRTVLLSGTQQEVANAVDAIHIFDVSWLSAKSIAVFPVENTQANVVKKELDKILSSQSKDHGVYIDTIDRFNALLVVAANQDELEFVREWLLLLDKEGPSPEIKLYVYDVQNRKATDLAEMLNGIFNDVASSVSLGSDDGESTVSNKPLLMSNKNSTAKPNSSQVSRSNRALRIVADEVNNSIVILSNKSQYLSIKRAIQKLDVLPLQVLIEVSILEFTLTDELSYGLEWYLKHNDVSGSGFTSDTTLDLNTGAGLGAVVPGFSFLLNGTGALVQSVFNTLASESKLNVISSPSLMVLDNHTATIRVGDQQPIQVASAKSTNNDVLTQSIQYKNTGVLLTVTPRVNSGGLVTLELSQEVTDVGSIDDATGQRSFLQRNINSTVAVQDGKTIILGGLISENKVDAESGMPGLYDLPILGAIFGKTSQSEIRRELVVLITPKVIYNHQKAVQITREYADKLENLKSSLQF